MQKLPNFGPYLKEKEKIYSIAKQKSDLLSETFPPRIVSTPFGKVSSVKEVIGLALEQIGSYSQLDNTEQKVALIDEVCIIVLGFAEIFRHKIIFTDLIFKTFLTMHNLLF